MHVKRNAERKQESLDLQLSMDMRDEFACCSSGTLASDITASSNCEIPTLCSGKDT
jgi:hypothetical protein